MLYQIGSKPQCRSVKLMLPGGWLSEALEEGVNNLLAVDGEVHRLAHPLIRSWSWLEPVTSHEQPGDS